MTLRELLENHTIGLLIAGKCECGEHKFNLLTDGNLIYSPVHKSTINQVKPDLLREA